MRADNKTSRAIVGLYKMDNYGLRGAAALLASVVTTLAVQFHRAKRNSDFAIVEAMPKVRRGG